MQLLRCCFQRRNAYRVTDICPLRYRMLHYARAVSNITTVAFYADDSLQLCCVYLVIILYYNTLIIYDIRHVNYLCFSMCLAYLVKVDAPDIAHVDGTLSMLNMSIIHNSKSVRGRWLLLTGCVSSDKSAMAS